MAAYEWQNYLVRGDKVEADHPIDGSRVVGEFLRCRGSRFCEILVGDIEYVVSYKSLTLCQ